MPCVLGGPASLQKLVYFYFPGNSKATSLSSCPLPPHLPPTLVTLTVSAPLLCPPFIHHHPPDLITVRLTH